MHVFSSHYHHHIFFVMKLANATYYMFRGSINIYTLDVISKYSKMYEASYVSVKTRDSWQD